MSRSASAFNTDFNPRTPVGCDRDGAIGLAVTDISIHAPQWGATVYLIKNQVTKGISIHAPQWGATSGVRSRQGHRGDFNPRTPVGCDPHQRLSLVFHRRFQSTHPSGVRQTPCETSRCPNRFQSTHPSGVRHAVAAVRYSPRRNFNPRTPVGCDQTAQHY